MYTCRNTYIFWIQVLILYMLYTTYYTIYYISYIYKLCICISYSVYTHNVISSHPPLDTGRLFTALFKEKKFELEKDQFIIFICFSLILYKKTLPAPRQGRFSLTFCSKSFLTVALHGV